MITWNDLQQCTIIMLAVSIPVTFPIKDVEDLTPFDDIVDKIQFVVAQATAGKPKETKTGVGGGGVGEAFSHQARSSYAEIAPTT